MTQAQGKNSDFDIKEFLSKTKVNSENHLLKVICELLKNVAAVKIVRFTFKQNIKLFEVSVIE